MATRRDLPTAAGSANSSSCSSSPIRTAEIIEKERKSPSPSSVISSITNKGGRFKVTKLSATADRKRKTPPSPVFIDFFLDDEIRTSTIAAAANQQPPPSHDDHHHHSEDEITTELGLGWGPYIPIKKTTRRDDDDQDPDDELALRIGPPIQKLRWRRRLFPDGYWEIKKRLTKSDVNGSSRLLIHRKLVEHHVLVHLDRMQVDAINNNGMEIAVLDVDTETQHRLVLKLWPSSWSYVLTKNWSCDFVRRRELAENQEIGLRWDIRHSRLEFAVLNY